MPASSVTRRALGELGVCTPLFVQEITDAAVDAFAPDGRADLMVRIAVPLPALSMQGFLGADEWYADRMRQSVTALTAGQSPHPERAARDLHGLIEELVAEKAVSPGPDLVSWMLHHSPDARPDALAHEVYDLVVITADTATALITGRLMLELPGPGREGSGRAPGDQARTGPPESEAGLALLIADAVVDRLLERLPGLRLRLPVGEIRRTHTGLPLVLDADFPPVRGMRGTATAGGPVRFRLPEPSFTITPPDGSGRR
ncbi:hypothetical protein [Streptomyces sp. NPDC005805]|uniref:hypothetical protein n=1 Tax=Streptomyces sp. NPDC005805 TaxID=3157068 RepID=UPI0033CDAA94